MHIDLRELWLWKEIHYPLVSKALDDQGISNHRLDKDSDADAPDTKSEKARGGKEERQKKNATAEPEDTTTATPDPDLPIHSTENEEALPASSASSATSTRTYNGGSDFDASVEEAEQAEMGSSADQLVNDLASPQLKLYYAMVVEVIDEEFEEERRCVETMRQANERRAQKKMDAFWKLADILGLQGNDE